MAPSLQFHTAHSRASPGSPPGPEPAAQSGMILIMVVILAAAAATLASGLHFAANSRIKQVRQELRFDKAFFVAEAGIERAKADLRKRVSNLNGVLKGTDNANGTADDGILSFGESVPYGDGKFYVHVRDNADADASTFVDTDNTLIITSTGVVESATRVIEVAVRLTHLIVPPKNADGALSIYGTNTELKVKGNAEINGEDFHIPVDFDCTGAGCNGAESTNPAVAGVFYASTTTVFTVDTTPKDPISGSPRTTNGVGLYTETSWFQFINSLPLESMTVYSPGAALGTREAPTLTILPPGATLINGNTYGAGILIVPGTAILKLAGTFHYEGLIIVIGDGVIDSDVEFDETGTADIFGAVVCIGGELDIKPQGTPRIKYSTEALANLRNLQLPPPRLDMVYWKEIK